MRYLSLFSGVEAASLAWGPLGWEAAAFAEVDDFPCAVLAARFPEVPNLGDVAGVDWRGFVGRFGRPDVVVGGSPCQSFSVAGDRTGLDGASGLMWEYVRAVQEIVPDWLVWENVPGALSSTGGEDFGCLLRALDELGYGLAWRVLDAQFFGVAQRRRRVFLVGRLGDADARAACEVLFEPESLRWDIEAGRDKRKALAAAAEGGAGGAGGCLTPWDAQSKRVYAPEGTAPTLQSGDGKVSDIHPVVFAQNQRGEAFAVRTAQTGANGCGVSEGAAHALDAAGPEAVCYSIPENAVNRPEGGTNGPMAYGPQEPSPTLRAAKDVPAVAYGFNQGAGGRAGGVGFSEVSPTLKAAESGTARAPAVLCMASGQANAEASVDASPALTCDHEAPIAAYGMSDTTLTPKVAWEVQPTMTRNGEGGPTFAVAARAGLSGWAVRRLTPVECERLQGFPDGWTDLSGADAESVLAAMPQGKDPRVARKVRRWCEATPDGPRYKACGNSMAVPVMRWIGERVAAASAALALALSLSPCAPASAASADVGGKSVLAPCAATAKAWKSHGKAWRARHVRIGSKVVLARAFERERAVLAPFSDGGVDGARWAAVREAVTATARVRVAGKCRGRRWKLPRKVALRLGEKGKKVSFTWKAK